MTRYTSFILAAAYCLLSGAFVIGIARLFNFSLHPASANVSLYLLICWLLFCFSAVYWLPDLTLARMNTRHCIWEEEQLLLASLQEIRSRTGSETNYAFYILEDDGPVAFATGHRTIVVSRGLLVLLSKPELIAVLAHETGHLRSKDTVAGAAFAVALFITRLLRKVFRTALRPFPFLLRTDRYYKGFTVLAALFQGAVVLVLIVVACAELHVFEWLLAMLCLLFLLYLLDRLFIFLWRWNSRLTEYRQDSFAHELGYGDSLRDALLKITRSLPPQSVNLYTVLLYDQHPVVYNRIRRLEKLAGLRS